MTSRTVLYLSIFLFAVTATARADFTGHLGDLEAGLNARRAELVSDPDAKKTVKEIDKVLKVLAKPNTSIGYAKEVKAAAKIAKSFTKKLAGETALIVHLESARAAYRAELAAARTVLAGLVDTKKLEKQLKKADKALAKAALATMAKQELGKLAAAAKVLASYVGVESAPEATWVVKELEVAKTGLDLDGDGDKDNALGGLGTTLALLGISVQDLIDDAMEASTNVILIQMWDVDDWSGDSEVRAGIMNGVDTDGDASDNYSGHETFDVTDFVGMDGHPLLKQTFPLGAGGVYEATWSGEKIEIGGIELPPQTKVMMEGTASPARNFGTIAVAIPKDVLLDVIEDAGYSRALAEFALASSWDLSGGTAMSAAFTFDAVPGKTSIR